MTEAVIIWTGFYMITAFVMKGLKALFICNLGKQTELFQDREGFVELGHLDKQFVKNTRKKGPAG